MEAQSPAFTCISCSVKFADAELQRQHYKTDWHRYNLKRRVSELPAVTAVEFQMRVLQIRDAENSALKEKQMSHYCNACRKQFRNQKAHDTHLNSKKHRENLVRFFADQQEGTPQKEVTTKSVVQPRPHPAVALGAAKGAVIYKDDGDEDYEDISDEEEMDDSDGWEDIPEHLMTEKDCLFCTHSSEDVVENLKHMSVAHSFFIPDAEYCVDVEGLLNYLSVKVAVDFICLWCNDRGKTFYSLDAVRKHMIDKGHCQLLHEGLALAEYADYYDYSSSYPDHEEGMDIDQEVVPELLDGDEYQLVLPSGAVIGHRSLLRYYKQRLNSDRTFVPKKSDRKLHRVLGEYRSLGWTETQQKAAARKARDIHVMKRVEAKWQTKLSVRANKLMRYYRPQVLF